MFAIPHRQLNRRHRNPNWGKVLIGAAVLGGGAYLVASSAKAAKTKPKTKVINLAGKNIRATIELAPAPWVIVLYCGEDLKNAAIASAKAVGLPRVYTLSVEDLGEPEFIQRCIDGQLFGALFAGRMDGPVLEVLDGEDDERVFVGTFEDIGPKTEFAVKWAAGRLDDPPTQGMIKLKGDVLWTPLNVEPPLVELRASTTYLGPAPTEATEIGASFTSSAPEVAEVVDIITTQEKLKPKSEINLTTGEHGVAVLTLTQNGFERQMFVRVT